jgi:hypothetical protein
MNSLVWKAIGCLAAASICYASPITYTFTASATGSIGSTNFTNAPLTIMVSADTADIQNSTSLFGASLFENTGTATSFSVGGMSGAFDDTPVVLSCINIPADVCGAGANLLQFGEGQHQELDVFNSVFSTYALDTTTASISSTSPQTELPYQQATSIGALNITSLTGLAFQASLPPPASTPEPATLVEVSIGLLAVGLFLRDRTS